MNASELLKCYAVGERDFPSVYLANADLSGTDLIDVNLSNADLSFSNLNRTNLSFSKLNRTNLSNALFFEAILSDSDLICANLTKANFWGAELYYTILRGANLSDANLSCANLCQTNFETADLSRSKVIDSNLTRSNLYRANLSGANLSGTDLSRANLSGANLSGADLSRANLSGANLFEANLTNANLSGTKLDGTLLAYKKVSEELQEENQELIERVKLLEARLEKQKSAQGLIEVSNQGIKASSEWNRFYFRSKTEIKIAEVLDRAGVLFYPNSKARLNKAEARINKESDFLVFQSGKFGILEVDGREWHQIAADDHERDRLFKRYGIRVIERFDATRCWNEPDKVVQEFLEILSQA
jgi:uncharacterized protein YjbI with pentapeptide repeats